MPKGIWQVSRPKLTLKNAQQKTTQHIKVKLIRRAYKTESNDMLTPAPIIDIIKDCKADDKQPSQPKYTDAFPPRLLHCEASNLSIFRCLFLSTGV